MTSTVLISGAGLAGPTLAFWLTRAGWDVTLVERFDRPRDEGQNVDVRGAARDVLRKMGLEDAARANATTESGLDFVRDDGVPFASLAAGAGDSDGPTAELEIVRGRLSRLLTGDTGGRFGDQIAALDDDGDGVTVTFADGRRQRFDIVVIAEGLRSRTRAMVMPEARIHELRVYCAYVTIPRAGTDTDRWRWLLADRGRTVAVRPRDAGTMTAMLTLRTPVRGLERLDRAGAVSTLRANFAGLGWETPRVLAALDDAPLYFEALGQARLESWSRGRIALLGDAAWATSPFAGVGATLAIAGAYILAGELATHPDPRQAFQTYERRLRPAVTAAQKSAPAMSRLAHPHTRLERTLLQRPLLRAGAFLSRHTPNEPTTSDTIPLPAYDFANS
ncbi:FAD-dependent monooxygenase [Actinoplanes sp. CA-054009]